MTGAHVPLDVEASKKREELGRLDAQVVAMRAVLTQLLQDLVRAETQLERSQATQLLEANERLVVSALGALTEAETANGALNEASRTGGHDQLTGLPNRMLLLDRLDNAISNSKRHGKLVALLFLDLNGFKQINDAFGHAAGDRALQLVADCLTSLVRETDTVSRHGGDEFLILLAEVEHAADAAVVAEKVNSALGAFSQIDDHPVGLTASIGISVYPQDGTDAATLIDRADAAMYVAKGQEHGGFVFHADHPPGHAGLPSKSNGKQQHLRLSRHESEMIEHELRHEELREVNEQLVLTALGTQELLAAAEETRRRQSKLLTLVANELRNPFAPIRLAAATLGRPDVDKVLLPRAQAIIEQQVDRVLRLVSEVLDPRQATGIPLEFDRSTFDAAELIGAAVQTCRPAMDRRQQTLEMTVLRPLEMVGDSERLTLTLMSLLSNASVYTDDGGWIRVSAEVVGDDLLLNVVDSGRADPRPAGGVVFNPFVLDPRASLGVGDGVDTRLAAVRGMVEAHGGTVVAAQGGGGHGSQFTVSLPTKGSMRDHGPR